MKPIATCMFRPRVPVAAATAIIAAIGAFAAPQAFAHDSTGTVTASTYDSTSTSEDISVSCRDFVAVTSGDPAETEMKAHCNFSSSGSVSLVHASTNLDDKFGIDNDGKLMWNGQDFSRRCVDIDMDVWEGLNNKKLIGLEATCYAASTSSGNMNEKVVSDYYKNSSGAFATKR